MFLEFYKFYIREKVDKEYRKISYPIPDQTKTSGSDQKHPDPTKNIRIRPKTSDSGSATLDTRKLDVENLATGCPNNMGIIEAYPIN